MNSVHRLRLCPLVLIAASSFPISAVASPPRLALDVTEASHLSTFEFADCQARPVSTQQGPAIELAFGRQQPWPHVRFLPDRLGYSTDWSEAAYLAVTLSNPTEHVVKANLRVDTEAAKDRGRQGGVEIPPGRTVRVLMQIAGPKPIVGMRGQPPLRYSRQENDVQLLTGSVAFDPQRVTRFQIFLGHPEINHILHLHRIEWIPLDASASHTAFVDRFGQFNAADWPGKLHDEAELSRRLAAEQAWLTANPSLTDRDDYGGWKDGPQLEATGRFRVQEYDGRWSLVDPQGKLFWSSGITCVRPNADTLVAGRKQYFDWLPADDESLAQFYSGNGRRYNFFQANAFRKYGDECATKFYDIAAQRFRSWGVNTIANWSDPAGWRLRRVPYTIPVHVPQTPMFVATSHMKAGLEKKKWFPDPFDPKFREGLTRQLRTYDEFKDDPWLLGVFIHNELPWTLGAPWRSNNTPTGIGVLCLQKNDISLAAKVELLDWLKHKYASISDLNRAWGTSFAAWDPLEDEFELTDRQRQLANPDLTELDRLIARQYFRVCREAMNECFPGVLYLGCRFSGMYDRHFVDVAREYCDVVSFNIYDESPSGRTADELADELNFPAMIGEFHFGALDRGMFDPGLRKAKDQAERAEKYAAYIREAAAAPWCVGAHWFQYLDQALTGRSDGENYNIGFVDGTDDPYPEMRDAARRIHSELYRIRYAGAKPDHE